MPNPVPRGVVMPAKNPKEEAEQLTGFLKGALQAARVAHLSVGRLLALVRDRNLFAALGYADLDAYARERLQLGRASLYHYLKVFDWVQARKPEWLEPAPGTFIPDFNDLLGLIWIEQELEKPNLSPLRRDNLVNLKQKAETGTLKKAELAQYKSRSRGQSTDDPRKAFLASLKSLRDQGARIKSMPPEITEGLDDLIALLRNAIALPDSLSAIPSRSKRKVA